MPSMFPACRHLKQIFHLLLITAVVLCVFSVGGTSIARAAEPAG